MRLRYISIATLLGRASAAFGRHDVLAAQGMINLEAHVATSGYPEPGTCSLEKARVRREWYVGMVFVAMSGHCPYRASALREKSSGKKICSADYCQGRLYRAQRN